MMQRNNREGYKPVQTQTGLKMYVDDDNRSVLSMRSFKEHKPISPWKKLCGAQSILMVLIAFSIGFFMGCDQSYTKFNSKMEKKPIINDLYNGVVRYSSTATPLELLGLTRKTSYRLKEKLSNEYGDYASIFMDKSKIDLVFQMSNASKSRYHRRIIQKILKKQLNPSDVVPFTWVTAGDVRAAGFGNDPGNSYTSMMDDTAREAFAAVGLNLVAKNQGIYNFPSGPALSLCINKVYGSDIDILSWDFALADGDFHYRSALFGMRATLHPTKPLLMMIDSGNDQRWKKFFWGEGKVGVALLDTQGLARLVSLSFPDSLKVTNPEQLPPALRYLQCNGSIEGHFHCQSGAAHHVCNDDIGALCRENKFLIKDSCDMVKYQSDWNSGWYVHPTLIPISDCCTNP
jgi:hypothetical protein